MRLSNLPAGCTDKMIEDQSAEACIRCEGTGIIHVVHQLYNGEKDLEQIDCDYCDGSGIEPKRSERPPDYYERESR